MSSTQEHRLHTVSALRWVLIGLSGLLGLFLLARGFVVIGALLLVMAAVRAVMVVQLTRLRRERLARRREVLARRRGRWQPPTAP
jgi:hypothetical protein